MTPPIDNIITPTGHLIPADSPEQHRAALISAAWATHQLDRVESLRAEALSAPIGAEWDEMDRGTYLRYLDETEEALKGQVGQ
jgi:hypothetical protein